MLVVWARWVSRVLLDLACRVVRVVRVWVVCRRRWLPVLVVRVWGLLVVWLARSVPVPVPVLVLVVGVGLVQGVVACRVMHTPVLLVRRVLLLVVRWVLVRALPVLVWALVVVSRVSVLVCQVRARCRVRQRRLVPLLVRAVVVPVA